MPATKYAAIVATAAAGIGTALAVNMAPSTGTWYTVVSQTRTLSPWTRGGYVLVPGKLLALMSKDNNASLYLKNDNSGAVTKYSFRVDTNGDGVYDAEDCYGQHFKFYIITSPYSFSCGNAMPFCAQKNGFAMTTGSRSGGGECTVDTVAFPFGQTMLHSSSNHIGLYNETTGEFTGAEAGVDPNVPTQFNIYGVDKTSEILASFEKMNGL